MKPKLTFTNAGVTIAIFLAIGGPSSVAHAGTRVAALITGSQVRDGSLTGKDIKDHSLTADDIAASTFNTLRAAAGAQGPQGERGAKGDTGAGGATGDTGATGQQGAKGEQGPKGDPGVDGKDGTDGVNGKDGAQGPKGDTGAAGADGKNGKDGAQGPKGDPGTPAPPIETGAFARGNVDFKPVAGSWANGQVVGYYSWANWPGYGGVEVTCKGDTSDTRFLPTTGIATNIIVDTGSSDAPYRLTQGGTTTPSLTSGAASHLTYYVRPDGSARGLVVDLWIWNDGSRCNYYGTSYTE